MINTNRSLGTFIFYIFILTGSISLWSQERIGVAAAVDTVTTDLTLEQEKKLVDEGYKIIQNHTIETDENGKAQMLLVDGTAFTVGPNSSVTLDSFIYNPETAEGSLTVTSKGLMRLVGGKVTKNNPAIIRTNAATVGIRGGIVFVDSEGETTEASFIYGDEMTVTPSLNQDGTYVLTRNGFVVVVDDPLEDVEDVSLLTAEQLLAMQESLQGSPEEEEEETEEETSEESESEESEEEESEEESSEEESEEEGESEDESSEEESESEDESESESEESEESSEESSDESESSDSEADENSGSEDGSSEESTDSDNETEAQDTDNTADSDTNQDGVETDGDTDNEPEIDESALDSSGISDNSSDVEPDQLSTATDIDTGSDIDVAAETETESAEETEAVEDVSEVAQETVQDTAQQEDTAEAAEGTPLASALAGETTDSLSADITITPSLAENASNVSIGTIDLETTEDNQVTVEITGADSDKVVYNPETQEIILISGLDFEDDSTLDITVSISDELGNNQTDNFTIAVTNQNDAPSLVAVENNNLLSVNASLDDIQTNGSNISETTEIGAVVASVTVADQDGDALQYSLSGAGSENFAISSTGEITLASSLNFESQTQYTIEVTSTDGLVSMTEEITIYVVNDNEAPSLAVQDFSISEASSLNSVVATAVGNDPENTTISYSLSGGGDKFTIDNNGQITLTDSLDYESNTTYELTVFASDGFFSVPKIITVTVTDANDAPSLSSSVAFNSFLENTAVGSTIATSTFSDPESDTLSFSLSGTGSDKFSVDADGKVTLASALDYESATSYTIALEATDGVNTVTKSLLINVGDVTELSYTGSLAANSQLESINTGTVILTSSVSNGQGSLTYSISDPDNKFAINSSTGEVTLDNALDFETKTSHSFTVSVTDGSTTLSETFSVSVSDIDLSYTGSLASSSQSENISAGTVILNSSASNAEGTITYSITDADNKFAINSSTGQVTLANALDYETKTSHTFTVSANDGTTTTSTTFTLNVSDASGLSNLVTTLANPTVAESGTRYANFNPGTAVASVSGLANELGGSPVYSITSGNEKNIFAVNSSTGAITTNIDLDFETAKSHTINLTATVGSDSTTTAITIPVKNARENNASLVRYSGAFHNASRSGLSATATRGHQAGAETFEEVLVGLRNPTRQNNQDNIREEGLSNALQGGGIRLQYGHGVKENLDFYFPVFRSGDLEGAYAPNNNLAGSGNSVVFKDGFYWPFGGATDMLDVNSTGGSSKIHTAGRTNHVGNGWHEFAFMTTQTTNVVSSNFNIMEEDLRVFCMGYAESYCNNASGYFASANLQTNSFMFDRTYTSEMAQSAGSSLYTQQGNSNLSDNYLNRFNVIIDNREYVSTDATSTAGMATDLKYFVDWMKLPSSLLYVKIYGDYRDDGNGLTESELPQQTRKWVQAIGGDVEFSNNWNAGTGGYRRLGGTFASGSFYEGLNNTVMYVASPGPAILSATNGQPMYCGAGSGGSVSNFSNCMSAYFRAEDLGPGVHADLFIHGDLSSAWGTGLTQQDDKLIRTWMLDKALSKIDPPTGSNTPDAQVDSITYYKDMVTVAGGILADDRFTAFTDGGKVVTAWVPIPIENTDPSGIANDYFLPAFIPIDAWKNMTVNSNDFNLEAANLCIAQGASWTCNNMRSSIAQYEDQYEYISNAMVGTIWSEEKFYYGSDNLRNVPSGTSHLWQVLNDNGIGVGLYAQISVVHSSNTNRDDQQSLLNVVITQVDHRSNDTTRYSVGDTGMGMDGYHYWSFQDDTSSNSRGIHYGVGPIECATATEAGCFFGGEQSGTYPVGAMLTSSDPYKSSAMTLAVSYDSREDSFQVGTFNQAIVRQSIRYSTGTRQNPTSHGTRQSVSLSDFRSTNFYSSSANSYSGFFGGLLEFDVSGVGNGQLARVHSTNTLATFTFDATNDDVQVVAPMTVASAPSNNYTATWSTVDTGSMTLKFGDANNDQAKSAYLSNEIFGAQIQDDGTQIDGTSGGSNNLAGVLVSWETIDTDDNTLVGAGMPDCESYSCTNAEYSTWGAWAMGSPDISPNAGDQNAAVHLGFWVAGDMLDQSEIPTSGSASMSGKAVFNVAYRYNQANSDYGVKQYSGHATVNGSFNWGSGSYSGQLDFTNFDSGNSLVSNAGFTSFSVSLAGSGATYAGSLNDTNNGWTREAVIAGALYGNNTPVESGGRISVGLSKSGSLGTSGANDFYMAEGIYLID